MLVSAFLGATPHSPRVKVTWSTVNSMLRIYKLYDFPFATDVGQGPVPAVRSAFSSYPGRWVHLHDSLF
jgi:hypothetical protein